MTSCPLYNDSNLAYTGSNNPYALIQSAGKKRKLRKSRKSRKNKLRKTLRKTLRRNRGYIY
jgi:hypothetical protein